MSNKEKIKLANSLLSEVIIDNIDNDLEEYAGFSELSENVKTTIVKYWYLHDMSEVFINQNGEEIDEYLDYI